MLMTERTRKSLEEQTVSVEAVRQALSQLTRNSLSEGAMNVLIEYLQKLSSMEHATVVSLDEVYPYIDRIVANSKDDYLQPLLVIQALEGLFYRQV